MNRAIAVVLVGAATLAAGWAAHRIGAAEEPAPSGFVPAGAVLYLQAKDFSSLLADWNGSPQKQQWLKSSNYEVFARSRLFLRLNGASKEFAAASGLPPDMTFLAPVAGGRSALALYDIGELQFLYVTRLSSTDAMHSALWKARSKFETRSAGGITFYSRSDPQSGKEVAFALTGDYLLLATRGDLVAGALQLIAGSKNRTIETEPWWSESIAAAGPAGELRMVLNLEKLVPSPYFRSYWIQRNITEMRQYIAAVSDLFISDKEYREERVLLKKLDSGEETLTEDGPAAVADLARLIPAHIGSYWVKASPSANLCASLLETKILAPHSGSPPAGQAAPRVQLASGETGSGSDLETRIDQSPLQTLSSADTLAPLKALFQKNAVRAVLSVQSTAEDKDGVFVRIRSAVGFLGELDWSGLAVHSAVVEFIRPGLTAGRLGVDWQARSGYQELDGLVTLAVAVRGKYLLISDDAALLESMLARLNQKTSERPAISLAGFNHARERDNFARLSGLLDSRVAAEASVAEHNPLFISENIGSLSSVLRGVSSQRVVIRQMKDKVTQTVTYEWAH